MILESDIQCPSKAIHILNFGLKGSYNIGRRVQNDISISDISVSRDQAVLNLIDNKVYIKDNMSKFGTFKKILGLCQVPTKETMSIQIERTVFFLRADKRFTQCQSCMNYLKCNNSHDDKGSDHFLQVYDKFPLVVQYHLFPFLLEISQIQQKQEQEKQQKHKVKEQDE